MFWLRTSLSMYRGEQAGGEPGVVRLLDDEAGRGADRQLVEFARWWRRRRAPLMVRVATRIGSTPSEALGRAGDGADDLVDVDRLERAAALAHPHAAGRRHRTTGDGDRFRRVGERRRGGPLDLLVRVVDRSRASGVPTLSSISVTRCSQSSFRRVSWRRAVSLVRVASFCSSRSFVFARGMRNTTCRGEPRPRPTTSRGDGLVITAV